MILMLRLWVPWKMHYWISQVVLSLFLTIVGSWIVLLHISWLTEGDSQWFWFEGNFESYEKNKIERLGPEAARPSSRHL